MATDSELLSLYVKDGSESAFEELAHRHAAVVWGACLRILEDRAEAEDAAQATFLVLARKAKRLDGRNLAGWLHRTATFTARRALQARQRRLRHEKEARQMSGRHSPTPSVNWNEIAPRLDDAVAALPGDQRTALVLVYMQGRTRQQAASEMNCPLGTVHSRLTRGLERLRRSLLGAGSAVSASALAAVIAENAVAQAPAGLLASLAAAGAPTGTASSAAMSDSARSLAEGAMRTMAWAKVKLSAVILGATVVVAAGGALGGSALLAAEPPKMAEVVKNAPAGEWKQIQKDGIGGRVHSKVVYAPNVNALVYWGTRSHGSKFKSYDTEFFDVAAGKWIDAIPPEKQAEIKKDFKNWPGWNMGGSTYFYDYKGLKRPRPTIVYNMAAWDPGKKRVVYYCGITFSYDPAKRSWAEIETPTGPPLGLYGSAMCYDAHNKRIVLFGGFGAEAPEGRPGTWFFDCKADKWERPRFGPERMQSERDKFRKLGIRARTLRRDAQYLLGLQGEEHKKASAGLDEDIKKLVSHLDRALAPRPGPALPPPYGAALSAGLKLAHQARDSVAKASSSGGIAAVTALEAAEDLLYYRAVDALRTQPPPRCNMPMVYDPKNKLTVLFGGNHLDFKLSDTWVLDSKTSRWQRRSPKLSPPPQSLHAACYLPKSGLVFMASGQGNWTYDAGKNEWKPAAGTSPKASRNTSFSIAAVPGTNTMIGVVAHRYRKRATYVSRFDPAAPAAKHKPSVAAPLSAPFPKTHKLSRKYYDDLPAPDPGAFAAKIKALPENKWTPLPSEKEIRARTWSSCTFDSKRRELIYWGGGHSGNVNSNVDHFSMRTGRWSRNMDSTWKPSPFGAMAACPNGRTYYDEPWTMHARKTYAYDPVSSKVIMAFVGGGGRYQLRDGRKGRYTWIYDPRSGGWPERIDTPFKCGYNGAAVTTPKGVMLLDAGQMWKLDVKAREWQKVGQRQKMGGGEYDTMVYDSKRDRLIYLAGNIHYFPLATQKWEPAKATGIRSRDAAYVPGQDAVLAHVGSGSFKVLLCADEKIADGPASNFKGTRKGISEHALTMDPTTETILWIDANGFCGPFTLKALKLNVKKLAK